MLGLGRALGETMAVTFVVGNANRLSASIFDPGSTIASRIANEFNEADGLQLNALMALGCILFLVTFAVLIVARLLVAARRSPEASEEPASWTPPTRPGRAPRAPSRRPGSRVRPGRRIADRALKVPAHARSRRSASSCSAGSCSCCSSRASQGFSPPLFTEPTPGPGTEGGGIANAIARQRSC